VGEDHEKDVNQPELRIRGGAIIPLGKIIQNTTEKSLDPLTLLVCLDENGRAEGELYEDAGEGYGYLQGEYLLTRYAAIAKDNKVIIKIAGEEGRMRRPERTIMVELITPGGVVKASGNEKEKIVIAINKQQRKN
jgi:alpha-glucosidase